MELKVWVDGIQKVVCGVTYNTTCHDVVLALACALGQTGRFSLVEKWRDSERPVIPDECPLKSLHKFGEYAGEVRYYLIRSGMDAAGQMQMVGQKANVPASNLQQFRHNFRLPDQSRHCLHSSELIKRSSTFSGAHQSLYGIKSSSLSQSTTALSQKRCTHTPVSSVLSSTLTSDSGSYVTYHGATAGLSPNAISSSSLRSCYGSVQNAPGSSSSIESSLQPQINSHITFREDGRKHHSANISSYSHNLGNSSSISHKHNNLPQQLQKMSVDQPSQNTFYSNPGQAQQPTIESSQQRHPSSSQCDHSVATIKPQQRQQNLSSQSHHVTKKSDQQPHPVPSPRHHRAPSSSVLVPESVPTHVRLKDSQSNWQKEKLHDECLQSVQDNVPQTVTKFTRSVFNNEVETINMNASVSKVHKNSPFQHSQGNATLIQKPSSILQIAREYLQKNGNLQKLDQPNENTQSGAKLKSTSESVSDNSADIIKYATLDRHFTRSKPHPALPSRSLSIGHGDEDQKPDNKPMIRQQRGSNGDCLQHCAEEKTPHVIKTENSTNSSINKRMSSFASAVAHIRQYNGSLSNNKPTIAHIRQHSDGAMMKPVNSGSHIRQHSSDTSYADSHLKGIFSQSADYVQTVSGQQLTSISDSNSQCKNTSLQQSNIKPSSSFNCSSLLHKSAPSKVWRQSSQQESYIPQSLSFTSKFSETIQVGRIGSVTSNNYSSNNKHQESTHSEQEKLECKESGYDQNFPDLLTKNAATFERANKNEKLDVSREADTTSNQADREYRQLLKTVERQQERIKLQEAQINTADLEITSLEEKDDRNKAKLQAILEEISSFEVRETMFKEELDNLEKTEWINVLEKEHELDENMNLQITNLKAKLEHLKSEIKQQNDEEDKKGKEINSEEEREAKEKKQNNELEKQVISEKEELEEQLNKLNVVINERNLQLESLEKEILEGDTALNQKEEQVKSIEEELKTEARMTNCQSEVHSVFPEKMNSGTFPVSDSGEAILKILECQLSAQSQSTSTFNDEVDNLGGITSAQHLYTLGSVTTHNGIWV